MSSYYLILQANRSAGIPARKCFDKYSDAQTRGQRCLRSGLFSTKAWFSFKISTAPFTLPTVSFNLPTAAFTLLTAAFTLTTAESKKVSAQSKKPLARSKKPLARSKNRLAASKNRLARSKKALAASNQTLARFKKTLEELNRRGRSCACPMSAANKPLQLFFKFILITLISGIRRFGQAQDLPLRNAKKRLAFIIKASRFIQNSL